MALTPTRLRKLLHYNPETGKFTWKVTTSNRVKAGAIAGCIGGIGYWQIKIECKLYLAHRLAWLYVHGRWPRPEIDHVNLIKHDNRLANLREATHAQNASNCRVRKNSKAGIKGIYFDAGRKKWGARIKDGKTRHLGRFATAEEARAAFEQAAMQLRGEFARME